MGKGLVGTPTSPPLWIHPVPALCWQKVRFRRAQEVPKIVKDQGVPSSGQLQTQGVAGLGNLANVPTCRWGWAEPWTCLDWRLQTGTR